MKAIQYLLITFAVIFMATACTADFEDINTDPNKPSVVEPDYIFGMSPVNTIKLLGSRPNWFIFGNMTQQVSVVGGTYPHYGDGRDGGLWGDFYQKCILYPVEIEKNYSGNSGYVNRVSIASIWKNYLLSQVVAVYGAIPYTNASLGTDEVPYDKEPDIYRMILENLKAAADSLKDKGDSYVAAAEPLYGSDIKLWRKFAHSLRLKVAIRVVDYEEPYGNGLAEYARQVVAEELDNPDLLISNNKENCKLSYGDDTENQNPFFRDITDNKPDMGNYPVVHESFMLYLTAYFDPRIDVFAKRANPNFNGAGKSYLGRPSSTNRPYGIQYNGTPWEHSPYDGLEFIDGLSRVGDEFVGRKANWTFLSYPEICAIRAEAKYRGIWNGPKTAEEYYYEIIDSFADRYVGEQKSSFSTKDLTAYKKEPGIQWSTPVDTVGYQLEYVDWNGISDCYLGGEEDNLKRIVLQHWIALFYQGIDSWTLLRRTQELKLPPHWGGEVSTAGVSNIDGQTIYHVYIPQRLTYPISESTLNKAEVDKAVQELYGGRDLMSTRLKWAKPPQEFEGYPNGAVVREQFTP